ncbi:MAG: 3-isopropylmalate dehydrogenase [Saccharofermentans sp.]|nr:3-isopropylmalate dehydrogenase [Saccharofermentans sp.]
MSRIYNIAVIPGDGIGPEITECALKVLNVAARKYNFSLKINKYLAGGCAIDRYGLPLPEETLEGARASDAVLLGAVGGPKWDNVKPELRPERALLELRAGLGLYSNLRPAIMYPELSGASPLKSTKPIDIMIVRELTGGIYFGKRGTYETDEVMADGTPMGTVTYDTESYGVGEIARIVKQAFEIARSRNKHLTLVDKANVLATSREWRRIAGEVNEVYRDVTLDFLYIDNATMQLIARPHTFDTIVTSNMFGDILSDEAGQITGSIGMLPSASLGKPGTPGMYEPVHGSAPDIAGTGKANPLATILSAAMMLELSLGESRAALAIKKAVSDTIADGYRTTDIMIGKDSVKICNTEQMTDAVIAKLK